MGWIFSVILYYMYFSFGNAINAPDEYLIAAGLFAIAGAIGLKN